MKKVKCYSLRFKFGPLTDFNLIDNQTNKEEDVFEFKETNEQIAQQDDDDEEDDDDKSTVNVDPDRLKAFNVSCRLF